MVDDRAKTVQLPADTSIHTRVEAELTRLLFRLAGFGLFSNFALALILSAGLTAYFPFLWSLVWLGTILAVSLGRWLLNRRFGLAHRSDVETVLWRRYFSIGATVAGAA